MQQAADGGTHALGTTSDQYDFVFQGGIHDCSRLLSGLRVTSDYNLNTMNISALPVPDAAALNHQERVLAHLHSQIDASGGWISFARYMELVLYAPGLGYYSAGAEKFGAAGDFVTAPEMTPVFGQTLARQIMQILQQSGGNVLELGAGRGRLAAAVLQEMQRAEALPAQYLILEVSADLKQVQQQYLQAVLPAELLQRVCWLEQLPERHTGVVLANEVLDAIPVHVLRKQNGELVELGVVWDAQQGLQWQARPLAADVQSDAELIKTLTALALPDDYQTEINPASQALIASLANCLQQGALLLIDYGFSRAEYYHPQRNQGTLMCHYRHHAHGDALLYPGLQDITAHVDFTAMAQSGLAHGLQVLGYAGQAQFLINCGITDLMLRVSPHNVTEYAPMASQVQKLLSPAEMGELFKVLALGRGVSGLMGFVRGDRSHSL